MPSSDRPLVWLHGEIKTPPLQRGERLTLSHSRAMPRIGARCHELRVVDEDQTWRIVYRLDADALVITEVFSKKTQQTPKHVVEACQRRLRLYDELVGGSEDHTKKRRLESAGWRVGSAVEFLGLTEEDSAFVELKLALAEELRDRRQEQGLSQVELAKRIGSSQSRVAKMEASDPSVSVDLLIPGYSPGDS